MPLHLIPSSARASVRSTFTQAGKRVRLKPNIDSLYQFLSEETTATTSTSTSSPRRRWKSSCSALEDRVPADYIPGTEFEYNASGEIERILQVTAGYRKVATVDRLLEKLRTGPDRIVDVASSHIHVMLHVNRRDGFTIAVSENQHPALIAKRSVISDNASGDPHFHS